MITILYVEDDPNSRDVLQLVNRMHPNQFQITMFDDSKNFETKLLGLNTQPDIILLDIHVAPYTGFEMLGMIRRHSQYTVIPVVALTASVMNDEVDQLKTAGFSGVVSKPIDLDEFPQLLQRILDGEQIWYVL